MDLSQTTPTLDELDPGTDLPILGDDSHTSFLPTAEDPALPSGEDLAFSDPETNSEEEDEEEASAGAPTQDPLSAVQAIIDRQSGKLDELQKQAKLVTDSMRSILENDTVLQEAEEQVEAIAKQAKERKTALANNAESTQLKFKLKDLKEQMKDLEESLNNHLLSYFKITGVKVVDTLDGGQREFTVRARLLKKKQAL